MADKTTQKSRYFRVAVEGGTTDGRVIEASWIDEMAQNYNPETFRALVNIEHIKGYDPNGAFGSYGKILALEARDHELELNGKTEKRRALYAQVEPNDQLVALNQKGQKLYPSIEVNPNFAGKGQAYCVGLAVTDNPASLGTEMLAFSATAAISPLRDRKQHADNLFTATGDAIELVFEDAVTSTSGFSMDTFLEAAAVKFGFKPAPAAASTPVNAPAANTGITADAFAAGFAELGQGLKAMSDKFSGEMATVRADFGQLQSDVTTLKTGLSNTPELNHSSRPAATGSDGSIQTEF
ncbi:Phage capsid scaffolding protein (GPO) serine peptidase [compost metagenome]